MKRRARLRSVPLSQRRSPRGTPMRLHFLLLQICIGSTALTAQAQEAPARRIPDECTAEFQLFCAGKQSNLPGCFLGDHSKFSASCLRALKIAWPGWPGSTPSDGKDERAKP